MRKIRTLKTVNTEAVQFDRRIGTHIVSLVLIIEHIVQQSGITAKDLDSATYQFSVGHSTTSRGCVKCAKRQPRNVETNVPIGNIAYSHAKSVQLSTNRRC